MKTRGNEPSRAFPTTGNRKLICILIGFTDKSFTKTNSDFVNLFNQLKYTVDGATGSVRDFFLEASYNQLDLSVDIFGPYTAANNMAYYGANDASGYDVKPGHLVKEACVFAYNSGANFANYDNDNDGAVDGVYVIYAGYGEENSGAPANCIWAHAWSLSSSDAGALFYNGKIVNTYACSSELRSIIGTNITRIGVICHEFGHTLGAPDFYDTNYATGGQYDGTGRWDLQANGSWNGSVIRDGKTPAHPNPYTKIYIYNWATATTLTTPTTILCKPSLTDKTAFYRINTNTPNEFYLIENRQSGKSDFDGSIPGSGLLIYHKHATVSNNTTHPQRFYPVCANRATAILPASATSNHYGTINGAGCSFPGSANKTAFNGTTTPAMFQWTGTGTNSTGVAISDKPITNIVRNATTGDVTFDFMGGTVATTTVPLKLNLFLQGVTTNGNYSFKGVPKTGTYMKNTLQQSSLLPLNSPYTEAPNSYPAINNPNGPASEVVDWVLVELWETGYTQGGNNFNKTVVESKSLLLQMDGTVVDVNGQLPEFLSREGVFRIVVKHRNHLAVMSSETRQFKTGTVVYEFTTGINKAQNDPMWAPQPQMVIKDGVACMWAGDINADGAINASDLSIYSNNSLNPALQGTYNRADLNMDGVINTADHALILGRTSLFPFFGK